MKIFLIQKCISKHTKDCLIVYNYKKGTQKRDNTVKKVPINQLRKWETPAITYIVLKLYPPLRRKALLKEFGQVGICSSYHHVVDIISDWAANALQVYTDRNQVIPSKLREMVFTVFMKPLLVLRKTKPLWFYGKLFFDFCKSRLVLLVRKPLDWQSFLQILY